MERIVATILCGNNQAIVAEAVQSILSWVDLVILVDTGITDQSKDIVHGLVGDRFVVEPYTWINDFAHARNFAIQLAAQHGAQWAVTIDTDERLLFKAPLSTIEDLRRVLASDPNVQAWMAYDRAGNYSKERILRIPSKLIWSGRTHEALLGAAVDERRDLEGLTFFEHPKSPEEYLFKLKRDLTILNEVTSQMPADARWWYYLGQTHECLNEWQAAIQAYRRCSSLRDGWAEQSAWSCFCAARCELQLSKHVEAIESCAFGLALHAGFPELAWHAGFCAYQIGKFHDAVAWSHMSISLGAVAGCNAGADRIGFRHLTGWYEGPFDVLRYTYKQLGLLKLAAEFEEKFELAKRLRESLGTPQNSQSRSILDKTIIRS